MADLNTAKQGLDAKLWSEKLNFVTTFGELHSAIEDLFGTTGWKVFAERSYEAAGIHLPEKAPLA